MTTATHESAAMSRISRPAAANASRSSRPAGYGAWTIEELRALARQLQLPGADAKTRRELLEIFSGA